ncbi:hypothetical protein [Cryobacterium arcticum]|uniref:Uncharacterized protein n=1 Tax=Cryobacterium arcticum TaxID=670052 RepID=A0A1B1BK99_9MICO|nr:hypothetical protein [Cryobacterium arcticum]ANP73047.1 hypothetical protein PA27867_2095 [Cryobacterium arcticum]
MLAALAQSLGDSEQESAILREASAEFPKNAELMLRLATAENEIALLARAILIAPELAVVAGADASALTHFRRSQNWPALMMVL